MDLFSPDTKPNLLPFEGEVIDHGLIMKAKEAQDYYDKLFDSIEWKNDEAFIMGKHYVTKRKVAWYADKPFSYTYSNSTKTALPWILELKELKALSERITGATYNSCLMNLYHDGSEGMAWHSDGEKMLLKNGSIASISLGAERRFGFKHKRTKETVYTLLRSGSLIEMKGETQTHWLHRLPPTTKVKRPRINLTFRKIVSQ